MVGQQLRALVEVDVGPVGHVEAQALHVEEQGELVAEEVGRALGPGLGIGPVEGDHPGPVGEVAGRPTGPRP